MDLPKDPVDPHEIDPDYNGSDTDMGDDDDEPYAKYTEANDDDDDIDDYHDSDDYDEPIVGSSE
jgi:hypothetical protein